MRFISRMMIFSGVVGFTLFVVPIASADIIVDDFSAVADPNPWPVLLNTITTANLLETGLSGVVGGTRASTITVEDLLDLNIDFIEGGIYPNGGGGGVLDYSSTLGANGMWSLLYDANGAGLNLDITDTNDFKVDFVGADNGVSQFPYTLITLIISDGVHTAHGTFIEHNNNGDTWYAYVNLLDGYNLLDLTSIQSVSLTIDPGQAGDFRISQVYFAVPTPGSLAMLAVGCLFAFPGGRRKEVSVPSQ